MARANIIPADGPPIVSGSRIFTLKGNEYVTDGATLIPTRDTLGSCGSAMVVTETVFSAPSRRTVSVVDVPGGIARIVFTRLVGSVTGFPSTATSTSPSSSLPADAPSGASEPTPSLCLLVNLMPSAVNAAAVAASCDEVISTAD